MKFFALKISDPNSKELVERIKNGDSNLEILQLNQLESDLNVGEKVFIQLAGDKVTWEKGLIGLAEITRSPYDKGYDHRPKKDKNFKLELKMIMTLKEVIKREEFRFYLDTYDAAGIGPNTQGEQNQAIKRVDEEQAYAILRVIAEKDSSLINQINNLFGQYSDIPNYIFGKMPRMVENLMTYEEVLKFVKENEGDDPDSISLIKYTSSSLAKRKELFCAWMCKDAKKSDGTTFPQETADNYASSLKNDAYKLSENFQHRNTFFIYTNKYRFDEVRKDAAKDSKYKDVNSGNHNRFSSAIDAYSRFLNAIDSSNDSPQTCFDFKLLPRKDKTWLKDKSWPLNIIIYGAPGTGKTYSTAEYAVAIIEKQIDNLPKIANSLKKGDNERKSLMDTYNSYIKQGRIVFATFHQNYSYEDFVQGLRPDTKSETMSFKPVDGVFKVIADEAIKHEDDNYVLIIDEINRANISKVFGELITLIEEDKRWGEINQLSVTLPSGDPFAVPNNLYIVGTMNSADKSISLIDTALRRRFSFVEQKPNVSLVEDSTLNKVMTKINELLAQKPECIDLLVGHSYFMHKKEKDLSEIMNNNIIPLLYEYFYDQHSRVLDFLKELIDKTKAPIKVEEGNNIGRLRVESVKEKPEGN